MKFDDFLNEGKDRHYYDMELGIPLIRRKQVGFTDTWEMEWPDGQISKFSLRKLKFIKPEEYEKLKKDYFEHEDFMKKAYKDAVRREKEEKEDE